MRGASVRWLSALALVAGCAAAPKPVAHHKDLGPPIESPPMITQPARWDHHPTLPTDPYAGIVKSDGGCVFTSPGRERWTSTKSGKASGRITCSGRAESAQTVADEELVGVLHPSDKRWLFAGVSGALYETTDPLGPIERKLDATEPIERVVENGSSIFAATLAGKIVKLDRDAWTAASSPPAHALDVAFAGDGRGVALAFPEQLFGTTDGGATWKKIDAPAIGADRVGWSANGELVAEGFFESLAVSPGASPAFVKRAESLHVAPAMNLDPLVSASAGAVRLGTGAMDGDRYVGLETDDKSGSAHLYRGKLEGRLEVMKSASLEGCSNATVAVRGGLLATLCDHTDDKHEVYRVQRFLESGELLGDAIDLAPAPGSPDDQANPSIAIASDGSVLVLGACPGALGADCPTVAESIVRWKDKAGVATLVKAPELGGVARFGAFSYDARSAYFIGKRAKDEELALFVSHDGGESFVSRPLGDDHTAPLPPPDDDQDESPDRQEPAAKLALDDWSAMTVGEDGAIAILLRGGQTQVYVVTDDDGKIVSAVGPPDPAAILAGFGRHVLAVSTTDASVWESSDGGAHWSDPIPGPATLVTWGQANDPIVCGAGGCLLGDGLSRVGWGGGAVDRDVETADRPRPTVPDLRTTIVCELAPGGWTRVPSETLPGASTSMRGRSAWSTVTTDFEHAAVTVTSAEMSAKKDGDAHLVTRPLFSPLPPNTPAAMSLEHLNQMEGYVVTRVRFPVDAKGNPKIGAPLKNVEVAWENFMLGIHGHATIPDAGPLEAADLGSIIAGKTRLYNANLASISERGVFVQPHNGRSRNRTTWFLDANGKRQSFEPPVWPTHGLVRSVGLRVDAVWAGVQPVFVGLPTARADAGRVFLAGRAGNEWKFNVESGMPDADQLDRTAAWTYRGNEPGMTMLVDDAAHGIGWADYLPFASDGTFGAPVPLATPLELGDRPKPCTAETRASTPRLRVGAVSSDRVLFNGARHPIVIRERAGAKAAIVEPLPLLATNDMIVYGSKQSPCVAGFTVESRLQVTVELEGDLAHGWVFHPTPPESVPEKSPSRGRSIEMRAMSCKYDPNEVVAPDLLANLPGVMRPIP